MAYWIEARRNNARVYACDFLSDIVKLPTQTKSGEGDGLTDDEKQKCLEGSKCLCLEDGSKWMLGKESGWNKIEAKTSGGSGDGGAVVDDSVIYF